MRTAICGCLAGILMASNLSAGTVDGDYLEVRNANVWAGPCLTNSEVGLIGNQATLAWKVRKGSFNGVSLDGLSVVAVVFGDRTFGVGDQVTTRTRFVVDQRATPAQRDALVAMASSLARETVQNVASVTSYPIRLDFGDTDEPGTARLDAGVAKVRTRRMHDTDNTCRTEVRMAYPALSSIQQERGAFTIDYQLTPTLSSDLRFHLRDMRSCVLAKFTL